MEKATKAWLSLVGLQYPLTHSLSVLFALLEEEVGPEVHEYRGLEILTPFAVQFRYWAYDEEEAELDSRKFAQRADGLVQHVRNLAESAME